MCYYYIACCYGDVAQLARAHGSYPWCREFESPRRYQFEIKLDLISSFFYFDKYQSYYCCRNYLFII